MRIAITHPYSWPEVRRGAERIVAETARALGERGHDVTVFTCGVGSGTSDTGVRTVRYRRFLKDAIRHERWFGVRIVPELIRGRFDAVHSLMPYDALAAIATRRVAGHRTVYQEMGNPHRWWWESVPDGRARRRVVRSVDVYGCMSRYSLEVLQSEWGRAGALLPGGVRIDEFTPAPRRASDPTILFAGALAEPRKHLDTLLEAVGILADQEPRLRLVLSGSGDPTEILAAAPGVARAHTELLPPCGPRDLGRRYSEAWVTALPSEGETFGLVLVESLASGTPIVVADDCAPPELVTPDVGVVSQVRDAKSLAAALTRALELARDPVTVERCRERATEYDWVTRIAPNLESHYAAS